eukprot:SAG22_NODE_16956_length_314_cov_0.716279_1_plen_48_part_01
MQRHHIEPGAVERVQGHPVEVVQGTVDTFAPRRTVLSWAKQRQESIWL